MDMVRLASPEEISSLPKTSWNIHQPSEGDVREEALSTGKASFLTLKHLPRCILYLLILDTKCGQAWLVWGN